MNIMIVDDADLIRKRLVDLIAELDDVKVTGLAADAAAAYTLLKDSKPAVIIMDIQLPGENGIRVLEKIRQTNQDVKVIMLTNYPYPQYQKKCMDLGADYFLDKSVEFEKVKDILRKIRDTVDLN